MNYCNKCKKKAIWRCISCNLFMCEASRKRHITSSKNHTLIKLRCISSTYLTPKGLKKTSAEFVIPSEYPIENSANYNEFHQWHTQELLKKTEKTFRVFH